MIFTFCKANTRECQTILHILKNYGMTSDQQINFAKSSVQFENLVEDSVREDLKQTLGITTLGGMGTYLGIPESLGEKKKDLSFYSRTVTRSD